MVGGIEPRSLEDDPHGLIHLVQGLLAALGAFAQWGVGKLLGLVELNTTIVTPISVYRHTCTSIPSFEYRANYSLIKKAGQEAPR